MRSKSHLPTPGDPGAALVAIEPSTGHILAMAGGTDFSTSQLILAHVQGRHRAAGGLRVQGVHPRGGDAAGLPTSTRAGTAPTPSRSTTRSATGPRARGRPENAEGGGSSYTLQSATAHSVNTVFAQLVVELGPGSVVDMAHDLGIRSFLPEVCSVTLGSVAVNPLEMTNAYATLADRGVRFRASPLLQVRSPGGRIDEGVVPKGKRVVGQNVADLVTYTLQDVLDFGTGASARHRLAGCGQDGHGPGQRRRLVLRLHRPDRGVRVGGLPARARSRSRTSRASRSCSGARSRRRSGTTS